MDEDKKQLKGSPSRDVYKQLHKAKAPSSFYASDLDFILISKYPVCILACVDYKQRMEKISFAEVIAYNSLSQHYPVFIIRGRDTENGPFIIEQYISGDWRPNPPIVQTKIIRQCEGWQDLVEWEKELRQTKSFTLSPSPHRSPA